MTPPYNPASLMAGSESGAIVRAIFGVVGMWFALGILSSIFPEVGELMPIAVIGSIVWLFFRIKKSVNPAAMAQWKTQLEKMAAEAARQQRNKQP